MEFFARSMELFHKGGPVMYLLVMCSLFVVTIAVERFLYYRSAGADTRQFNLNLLPLLEAEQAGEAAQLCKQTPAAASKVILEGLCAYQRGGNVELALEGASMLAAARLRENLNYLSVIVTMAPLLGLLGTVVGMIDSFSVLDLQAGQPLAITGGVGEALVATATGLTVAIVALGVHTYFLQRLDNIITDMEQGAALILGFFSEAAVKKGRDAHEIA